MKKLSIKDRDFLNKIFESGPEIRHRFRAVYRGGRLLLALPNDKNQALKAISLYQPQSFKARCYVISLKTLVRLGLIQLLPQIGVGALKEEFQKAFRIDSRSGFLLGNPETANRKLIVYHRTGGKAIVTKIGVGSSSAQEIEEEYLNLKRVSNSLKGALDIKSFYRSEGKDIASFTVPWISGRSPVRRDYKKICSVLVEWVKAPKVKLKETDCWQQVVRKSAGSNYANDVMALGDESALTAPVHGDFAPWNVKIDASQNVYVLDWELYQSNGVAGWDWAHYLIQSKLLIDKMESSDVIEFIISWAKLGEGEKFLDECGWDNPLDWIGSYLLYAQVVLCFDRAELIECWRKK